MKSNLDKRGIKSDLPCKACVHSPYRSQYAAITLTTPCTSFTQILLTKRVIFGHALTLAP